MYARQYKTSKPAPETASTTQHKNPFASSPFVIPQVQPQREPVSAEEYEKIKASEGNYLDSSIVTYRPAPAPPRVQRKFQPFQPEEQQEENTVDSEVKNHQNTIDIPTVQLKEQPQANKPQNTDVNDDKNLQQDGAKATKPPIKVQQIQKAILVKDAKEVLKILATASDSEFTLLVQTFTAASTRWFLENLPPANTVAKQPEIIQRFKGERSAEGAIALKGKLYWAGGSGADSQNQYRIRETTIRPIDKDLNIRERNVNEFAKWMREGTKPNDTSKMNCWEAVLYGAYLAGVVTEKWLFMIHDEAARNGAKIGANQGSKAGEDAYQMVLAKYLGFNKSQPITKQNQPKRGDIVFMNGLSHVVMSLGTDSRGSHPVMSLWILPRDGEQLSNNVQKTTIEAINTDWQKLAKKKQWNSSPMKVTFAPNPF